MKNSGSGRLLGIIGILAAAAFLLLDALKRPSGVRMLELGMGLVLALGSIAWSIREKIRKSASEDTEKRSSAS